MYFKKPKGTNDILGEEIQSWIFVENIIREVCTNFNIKEIRTPIFEFQELFNRSVGETTDIVQKEMFTFVDRGNRNYTLKPEGTASVVRAFIEEKLYANTQPTKLFYITPAFRDERNQAGRYKQFHQFGVEVFGSYEACAEVEILTLVYEILNKLNIKNVKLNLNSLGGAECRKNYNLDLKNFLEKNLKNLCEDCKNRLSKNTLRVLDCKNQNCQNILKDAPIILDFLEEDSKEHFDKLQQHLKNLNIDFKINPKIVRGLDYYNKTVFEFVCESSKLGTQTTICGGGRYDNLINQFNGPNMGAVGFAIGLERLIILMKEQNQDYKSSQTPYIFLGHIGQEGFDLAQKIAYELRKACISCEYDISKKSVKAQLKFADKIKAKYSIIIGNEEIKTDSILLRNMFLSTQESIKLSNLKEEIMKRVKGD